MGKSTQQLLPVYIALGDDALKREEVMRRLKARLEESEDLSFDFDEFDAKLTNASEVITACESYPVIAQHRLVFVNNVEAYLKADLDTLALYVNSPFESSVLCLSAEKLAKNSKLYKALSMLSSKSIIACETPKKGALVDYVCKLASEYSFKMEQQAASMLIALIGENTTALQNEVKKICSVCEPGTLITQTEVKSLVTNTAQAKIWTFLEPFCERNLKKSLNWINSANDVSVYALIPLIYTRLRELICAKVLDQKRRGSELASELGLSAHDAWKCKNHIRYARRFSLQELECGLSSLRLLEQKVKTGEEPNTAFEFWLVEFLAEK